MSQCETESGAPLHIVGTLVPLGRYGTLTPGAVISMGVASDSRHVLPDADGLARSRIEFLTSPVPPASALPPVRPTILASWRRSREMHVAADKITLPYVRDPDSDSQLVRTAEPILGHLAEQLDGQPVSIILTDQTGLVLSRRSADTDLDRHLDRVLLTPGFSYAEQFVGTNGIGTALEAGTATIVFGHEHYAENLEDLACAGVPIHHPGSGRTIGAIDLTCWRRDAELLLLTLAKTTADQIQQALVADSGACELALFRAYRQACQRMSGIVFAVANDAVLLNEHARAMLAPADQDALIARSTESMTGRRMRAVKTDLTLPSGITARLYNQQVRNGELVAGVVAHVTLGVTKAPMPARIAEASMQLPGLVGTAPLWLRACTEVEMAFGAGQWIAVEGEAGVGKLALLRAAHLRRCATGHLTVLDAADAADDRRWPTAARDAIVAEPDTVVIRHVDRLDSVGLRMLCAALQEAREQPRGHPLRVAVTMEPGCSETGVSALLRFFPTTVQVPPLRMRLEDVERLVPFFISKLADGGKIVCSPEAMRTLQRGSWPGNVEQLHELVHQVVQHRRSGVIRPEDLPPEAHTFARRRLTPLEAMERDAIARSLDDARGDKVKAARSLGMSRATIYRRIHDYGIVNQRIATGREQDNDGPGRPRREK